MSLDFSTTSAMLKEMYPSGFMPELGFKDNPIYALMKKDTNFGGYSAKIPVDVAPVQASSATFSYTQTMAGNVSSTMYAFAVTPVKKYSTARITGEMVRASQSDRLAFAKALDKEIRNATRTFTRSLERQMIRDSQGWLGRVGTSGISTTSCTLAHATQAHCFEIGMEVVATDSLTGSLRSGNATVTKIDRSTGVLTTDSNWTSQISSMTDADYIIPYGDYVTASDKLNVSGFAAWLPATVSGSDSFFGVNRSYDRERLAGVYYDGSNDPIKEALINGQAEAAANGGSPSVCFISYYQYKGLINSLGSNVQYQMMQGLNVRNEPAQVGFQSVVIMGNVGQINVVPSPFVPYDVCYMIDPETWTLYSMGECPMILEEDGNMILRVYNDDSYEVRIGSYLQQVCTNPGANALIKLA